MTGSPELRPLMGSSHSRQQHCDTDIVCQIDHSSDISVDNPMDSQSQYLFKHVPNVGLAAGSGRIACPCVQVRMFARSMYNSVRA